METRKEILDRLSKSISPSGELIVYDFFLDEDGNPDFLFAWTKDLHVSGRLGKEIKIIDEEKEKK